jgi:hypothetical protein
LILAQVTEDHCLLFRFLQLGDPKQTKMKERNDRKTMRMIPSSVIPFFVVEVVVVVVSAEKVKMSEEQELRKKGFLGVNNCQSISGSIESKVIDPPPPDARRPTPDDRPYPVRVPYLNRYVRVRTRTVARTGSIQRVRALVVTQREMKTK